jgi:precorrin-6Y C5,15-methyltransferase (decarboxylating)
MEQAMVVIGSARLVAQFASPGQTTVTATRPSDVIAALREVAVEPVVVLMSGDVGFHSGAAKVHAALAEDPRFEVHLIPGISTVQFFAARLGLAWDDAHLVSCHGVEGNLVAAVRRHRHTIALTGGNIQQLAEDLVEAGYSGLEVVAGEDLGQDQSVPFGSSSDNPPSADSSSRMPAPPDTGPHERVTRTTVAGLRERAWSSLTVLSITNPRPDPRTRSGILDDEFTRGDVPMTKQAIRAHALAVLAVAPTDVCWDVGCGTGSVTIELALAAYEGMVWAIDKKADAIGLTQTNCRTFHVGNVRLKHGSAPLAMSEWPPPDVVFIGGTSGDLAEIVEVALRLNPLARILVTAIAIESAAAAIRVLASQDIDPQVTQLSAANGRAAGQLHLMMAQNPVTLIYGRRHG